MVDEISYMETDRCNGVALCMVELLCGGMSTKISQCHTNNALRKVAERERATCGYSQMECIGR